MSMRSHLFRDLSAGLFSVAWQRVILSTLCSYSPISWLRKHVRIPRSIFYLPVCILLHIANIFVWTLLKYFYVGTCLICSTIQHSGNLRYVVNSHFNRFYCFLMEIFGMKQQTGFNLAMLMMEQQKIIIEMKLSST